MDLFPLHGRISFHISLKGGDAREMRVRTFSGSEDLSGLFCFEVELSSESTIAPAEVVGQPALLEVGDDSRVFRGIVAMLELQGSSPDGALAYYHARLVPRVWLLGQGRNCRVFQGQTVRQIVETLLKEWGLAEKQDFTFALDPATALEPRVYCVQYQESDWAFISRLLEEEGIHYYFVHEASDDHADPESCRDKLVLTDTPAQHPGIRVPPGHPVDDESGKPSLVVRSHAEQNVDREHITGLTARQEIRPTSYTVRDQVFDMPWILDTSNEARGKGERQIEVFEYVGAPKSRATGDVPKLRMDQLEGPRVVLDGGSTCPGVSPGSVLVPADYPSLDALDEKDHQVLVVRVSHSGVQPQAESTDAGGCRYGNAFVAIPLRHPFRPDRTTPRPVVAGVQSATVVGPPNEEIYTDELGRVKVQFPWDRYGKSNERSSCWVPVAQTWSGGGWGTLFTPRINQQVLVQFIDGDPDQPLIVGQAYHLHNKPPYPLPGRKTVSTIKTESSPGKPEEKRGYNEIRFEDKKGEEELFVRAELDRNDRVGRDYHTTVGHDSKLDVEHDYSERVNKKYEQQIGDDKEILVQGHHREKILQTMTLEAKGPLSETVENARVVKVGQLRETVKGLRQTIVEQGNYVRKVQTGDATLEVAGNLGVTSKQGQGAVTTHGTLEVTSQQGACNLTGKESVGIACSDGSFPRVQLSPSTISLRIGQSSIALTASSVTLSMGTSSVTLDAQGVTVNGVKITSAAIGPHEISGAIVKIN